MFLLTKDLLITYSVNAIKYEAFKAVPEKDFMAMGNNLSTVIHFNKRLYFLFS